MFQLCKHHFPKKYFFCRLYISVIRLLPVKILKTNDTPLFSSFSFAPLHYSYRKAKYTKKKKIWKQRGIWFISYIISFIRRYLNLEHIFWWYIACYYCLKIIVFHWTIFSSSKFPFFYLLYQSDNDIPVQRAQQKNNNLIFL